MIIQDTANRKSNNCDTIQPGPYLGILRPWAQENFVPPPPTCSYSVMCKQKQHKKLTKDKTL